MSDSALPRDQALVLREVYEWAYGGRPRFNVEGFLDEPGPEHLAFAERLGITPVYLGTDRREWAKRYDSAAAACESFGSDTVPSVDALFLRVVLGPHLPNPDGALRALRDRGYIATEHAHRTFRGTYKLPDGRRLTLWGDSDSTKGVHTTAFLLDGQVLAHSERSQGSPLPERFKLTEAGIGAAERLPTVAGMLIGQPAENGATPKPRRKGRPRDTDTAKDRRIAAAWTSGQYRTHADLARELGSETPEVKAALDRNRKRRKK